MTSPPIFKSTFALPALVPDPVPEPLCASDRPLVLLPIRLETRFFTLPGGAVELRVRVYPDKIQLDSHETDLRQIEIQSGQQYWRDDWSAGNDANARATAWRHLADNFGASRAAFIARSLMPTNPQDRPASPLAPGAVLTPAPIFPTPSVATIDAAWRTAPRARLLPDEWIAILHTGTLPPTEVIGRPIRRPLNVGPDPLASDADLTSNPGVGAGTDLAADPGMKWMIDFTEAESAGMALRIPISQAMLTAGLDTLYVFGVNTMIDAATGASQLADLLDAHHYTDGVEFLRRGMPTNNTDDRRVSSSEDDPTHQRSFDTEVAADLTAVNDGSNAMRVGAALGLGGPRIVPTLGNVSLAAGSHEADERSMNAALWSVGWGYFLGNILGPETAGLTPALLDWTRDHFVNVVRAGGPFPILRAGRQPYGLLPVTSLDLWKPKVGDETLLANDVKLQGLLIKLRDALWRPALPSAARLGSRGWVQGTVPDADSDLADVMRVDGVGSSYRTQNLFGPHYTSHLRAFFKEDLNARGYYNALRTITIKALQAIGLSITPRLENATFGGATFGVTAPLVQAGEVSPWAPLQPDFIGALLGLTSIQAIVDAPKSASWTPSLLATLLRHSLLREIADATARIAATPAQPYATLQREAELVNLVRDPADPNGLTVIQTPTWKQQLGRPGPNGAPTIQSYLETLPDFTAENVARLGDVRASMAHLQGLDSELLQYLMQGTLDLSAHRLDAWITSFATKRLAAMTSQGQSGSYIGAYGWVENLRPLTGVQVAPPAGEQAPVFTLPNDSGFIHAPSATHAAAAALLRNAHLGAADLPSPAGPFAIDLSSRRVREATRLLDGVREGQPLGALLGYRIERRLHELMLDNFIAPLRTLAPIAPSVLPNGTSPTQTIAANNVVDGQLLFRRWKEERAIVLAAITAAATVSTDVNTVSAELDKLGDAVDGVSDALVAETAYQMARGNTSRVAAALGAIAQGNAPPPELEVGRMPRTGTTLTHRVLTLFSGTAAPIAGWAAVTNSPRAQYEPQLNAWLSKLIGDPRKVRCTVERLDDSTGAVIETRTFPLGDVGMTPMDFVYGVEQSNGAAPSNAPSDTEQFVLYFSKHKPGGFDVLATLRLQHARPSDLGAGELTLFDLLEQARAIRRLLTSARAADPEDVNPPERASQGTIDVTELETRVTRVEAALLSANNQLAGAVARTTATCEDIRTALVRLGTLGIGPWVPIVASGESPAGLATLVRQGKALLKIAASRMAKGAELRAHTVATDPHARRDQLVERYGVAFGRSSVILPNFLFDATSGAELAKSLAASAQTQGGDALAVNTWFTRGARVRDPIARLGTCLRTAEILGTGTRLDLKVAQLPFVVGERWVALPPLPGTTLPPSKLSLVVHAAPTLATTGRVCGLLVDEWTEVVPSQQETTAITFQYNPPDACAPQAVLLAVPPIPENPWTVESLHRVLMETLDLAKLRAVHPDLLGAAAHYLPGLYLAFNAKDDAVSTNLGALTN